MRFTLHATRRTPHGASRFVQAMSACFVKTRHDPSGYSRNARVYGLTTAAMDKLRAPSRLPSPASLTRSRAKSWVCMHQFDRSTYVLGYLRTPSPEAKIVTLGEVAEIDVS